MQPISSTSTYDLPTSAVPLENAGGQTGVFGDSNLNISDPTELSRATGGQDIESAADAVLEMLGMQSDQMDADVAGLLGSISAMVRDRITTLDVTDVADVTSFQSTLESLMGKAMSVPELQDPALSLMAGIADTASAALSFAKADPTTFGPTAGAESIALAASAFQDLSLAFEPVTLGEADYMTTAMSELQELMSVYPLVAEPAIEAGIPVTSLMETVVSEPDIGAETSALDAPIPEEDLYSDSVLSDPIEPSDDPFAEMMSGDPTADPALEDLSSGTDVLENLGLDELLPDETAPNSEAGEDPSFADMMAGESLPESSPLDDMIGEELPLDSGESEPAPTLSAESSGDNAEAEANQEALETRFQNLYVTLMEKQISFKEAVEAYKTDNQNAGKG